MIKDPEFRGESSHQAIARCPIFPLHVHCEIPGAVKSDPESSAQAPSLPWSRRVVS